VVVLVSLILLELTEDKGGEESEDGDQACQFACSKASGIMMSVIIARIAPAATAVVAAILYREVTERA